MNFFEKTHSFKKKFKEKQDNTHIKVWVQPLQTSSQNTMLQHLGQSELFFLAEHDNKLDLFSQLG